MKPSETQLLEQESGMTGVPMPSGLAVNRRDFFKTLGSGVMVLYLAPAALAQEAASTALIPGASHRRETPR